MRSNYPDYAAMPILPTRTQPRSNRPFFIATPDDCWVWHGSTTGGGYGQVSVGDRMEMVHRIVMGLVPGDRLDVDHVCRNPPCCRPDHLDVVTHQENMLRSIPFRRPLTHCKNGHPWDEENTRRGKNQRYCRACRRIRGRKKA